VINIAVDNHQVETLAALGHEARAQIVAMLARRPHTATEIHDAFPIAAPAVSRHLRVLRERGVIEEQRPPGDRRVRVYTLRSEALEGLRDWLDELSRGWQGQLDSFKDYVALRGAGGKGKS
jgi:DNA-binding transcriptional ArsR family regulator